MAQPEPNFTAQAPGAFNRVEIGGETDEVS